MALVFRLLVRSSVTDFVYFGYMGNSPKRRERQMVRLLGILGVLLEGGRPTVRELAERFGTRRETIYRDLHALEDAGYPISGDENGCLSRPRLELGRGAPRPEFTAEEVEALRWAVLHAPSANPLDAALRAAVAKLDALAKPRPIEQVFSRWHNRQPLAAAGARHILPLVEAILRRARCRVTYRSPASPGPKTYFFEPYKIVEVECRLYCIGRTPPHEGFNPLALQRIEALEVTPDIFERDPSFDEAALRATAFGIAWDQPMEIRLRFRADQAPYVTERVWHPSQQFVTFEDGSLQMSFRAGGSFEIVRWILGWGDAVTVEAPESLRATVASKLEAALEAYSGRASLRA